VSRPGPNGWSAGRYRMVKLIAAVGGMGEVGQAPTTGSAAAFEVKLLKPETGLRTGSSSPGSAPRHATPPR